MTDLYGTDVARARGLSSAPVIAEVDSTSRGVVMLTVGEVLLRRDGTTGNLVGAHEIRLSPAERDRLIDELVFLRTADAEQAQRYGGAR